MMFKLCRLVPLLFALGCDDYGFWKVTDPENGPDTGDQGVNTGDESTWPKTNGEWCNGEDDDGDGLVDEEFPDTDGDGIADCIDDDCDVRVVEGSKVGIDLTCAANGGEAPEDPWAIEMEWAWRGLSGDPRMRNVFMPPIVANITDDNLDGLVNEEDDPDIIVVVSDNSYEEAGVLVVLDGRTGKEHFSVKGIYAFSGVAVAEINGDGRPDIAVFDFRRYPLLLDGEGNEIWRSTKAASCLVPMITAADLDADGIVDVVADTMRLRGDTGALINWFSMPSAIEFRIPAVGDVDLDGQQEVLLGNTLFAPDGTRKWIAPVQGIYGHWSAIIDADGDPYGEIAMVADGRLLIIRHDGEVIVDEKAGNDHPGGPCVADFDGDGEPEIGWAANNVFNLYNLDGSVEWSRIVSDGTGLLATCSGFDFDGDGSMEILYNDNSSVYLLDGKTGGIYYSNGGHASTTVLEYPTIADVDGDGSAEVVVASNTLLEPGWTGITVLGHVNDEWMASGPDWHVHDYMVSNIKEDGTVPRNPVPPWQTYNMYRARPSVRELSVDLQVAILDACFTGCHSEAMARFAVQVFNTGANNSSTGIHVAFYANYGGKLELLDVQVLAERVGSGMSSESMVFEVPVDSIGPDGVVVRVDDDGMGGGRHEECDEENNEVLWLDVPCE